MSDDPPELDERGTPSLREILEELREAPRDDSASAGALSGARAAGARRAFEGLPRETVSFEEEPVHRWRRWKNRRTPTATNRPKTFEDHMKASALKERRDHIKLRGRLGNSILALMALQLLVADVAFFLYGYAFDWRIPTAAISAWLAALVIEIIAVVRIVARFLFPPSGLAGDDFNATKG